MARKARPGWCSAIRSPAACACGIRRSRRSRTSTASSPTTRAATARARRRRGRTRSSMLADDLQALLEQLRHRASRTTCGLSMGGMIGQTFALKYPRHLRAAWRLPIPRTRRIRRKRRRCGQDRIRIAESKGMAALVQPTLERWFTQAFRNEQPDEGEAVAALIAATPVPGYVGCCPRSRRSTSPRG